MARSQVAWDPTRFRSWVLIVPAETTEVSYAVTIVLDLDPLPPH